MNDDGLNDPRDARRLEELSLNSSAPPGQLLYDGWLLRLFPGKARRARSVNALYRSTLPLDEKIAYCERLFRAAGLPLLFRMTPFSEPADLDAELERRGYARFDETAVESTPIAPGHLRDSAAEVLPLHEWVVAVGELRGSSREHVAAHLARLAGMPLAMRGLALRAEGRLVATGLAIVEDDWAGLFDIITHAHSRREGHARRMVQGLLRHGWELGARHAYLQVQADNVAARRLYTQFGFAERYLYSYRARPGDDR